MHWSDKYIGLSYDKYNCAELVQLILKKEYNKKLVYQFEMPKTVLGMSREMVKQRDEYLEKSDIPQEGGAIIMHAEKNLCHIGLTTRINGSWYVLHSINTVKQCIRQRLTDINKFGLRLEGYYKWLK